MTARPRPEPTHGELASAVCSKQGRPARTGLRLRWKSGMSWVQKRQEEERAAAAAARNRTAAGPQVIVQKSGPKGPTKAAQAAEAARQRREAKKLAQIEAANAPKPTEQMTCVAFPS